MKQFFLQQDVCCNCGSAVCFSGCLLELSLTTTLLDEFEEIDGWNLQACSSEQPVAALETGEPVEGACVCSWRIGGLTGCIATKEINGEVVNTPYSITISIECSGSEIGISGSLRINEAFLIDYSAPPGEPPEIIPGVTRDFVINSPLPEFINDALACCPEVDETGFGPANIEFPETVPEEPTTTVAPPPIPRNAFITTTANSIVTDPGDGTGLPTPANDLPEIEIRIEDIGWNCLNSPDFTPPTNTTTTPTTPPTTTTTPTTTTPTTTTPTTTTPTTTTPTTTTPTTTTTTFTTTSTFTTTPPTPTSPPGPSDLALPPVADPDDADDADGRQPNTLFREPR